MTKDDMLKEAVLRVGEVIEIDGRKISIKVDKNKNSSELLFDGNIIKNVSVGSYIGIKKGFLSLIGKVDGEKLIEDVFYKKEEDNSYQKIDKNNRILIVSLMGYIDYKSKFFGGIKELPLIGNETYILTDEKIHLINNLVSEKSDLKITIAKTEVEDMPISFPIDGLFNSHIAIFGNTGSGKSNTLASLYQATIEELKSKSNFKEKVQFLLFDFNGEYAEGECITENKKVYNLSTKDQVLYKISISFDDFNGEYSEKKCIIQNKQVYNLSTKAQRQDKIPISFDDFMDIETLSILFEATDKTQKPFLNRALKYYKYTKNKNHFFENFKNIMKANIKKVLLMTDKAISLKILDYLEEIFSFLLLPETINHLRDNIRFHDTNKYFYLVPPENVTENRKPFNNKFSDAPDKIEETNFFRNIDQIEDDHFAKLMPLNLFFIFLLLQLIRDLSLYKIQLEHILPFINRFKARRKDIEKIFNIDAKEDIWNNENFVVVNLHHVNLDMRKTIPLLLAKYIYNKHKKEDNKKSLSIIIDEAHNILSKNSFRETEEWKDYRLETFEEIIKEGRKFGVFVTIASQRPNDISETIISQAHNYFIHQLVNQRDLQTIGNAISYIDKITEESIPTLSVGTCIFSGLSTPMPLKIHIKELPDNQKPNSQTLQFKEILKQEKYKKVGE